MPGPDYERFDGVSFLAAIDALRSKRGLSWAELGRATGVSPGTIKRFAVGDKIEADGVFALVRWVERPLEDFSKTNARFKSRAAPKKAKPRTMLRRDTARLYEALVERSQDMDMTLGEIAAATETTMAQINRLKKGGRTDIRTFLRLLEFLEADFGAFTRLADH